MQAMILAAGAGTRLLPHTLNLPKPMLPVSGRPTLEWVLLWLRHYGIRDLVINLHHRPNPVVRHFGDGSAFGVKTTFSIEEALLGTAGGVKHVAGLLQDSFVVVYGDVLTDMDLARLIAFHNAHGEAPHVTLSLCQAPNPWECGVVAVDERGRVTQFVEKPPRDRIFSNLTNAGILVMDRPVLDHVPSGVFSDISQDLLPKLLSFGVPLFARRMEAEAYLIDIGTPEKYERVQREWPTQRFQRVFEGRQ
jgi:NDP-sugar pyrophosphorylase family protein